MICGIHLMYSHEKKDQIILKWKFLAIRIQNIMESYISI
jgi:hypothetical protein